MNIESIVIHTDIKEKLDLLSDAEAGQLFKAIIAYAKDGTIFSPDDNRVLGVIFLFVKDQIERDYAKYLEKSGKEDRRSEANRKNANKRWQKAKECNGNANECNGNANASEEMQADATESLPNSIPIITPNLSPQFFSSFWGVSALSDLKESSLGFGAWKPPDLLCQFLTVAFQSLILLPPDCFQPLAS